MDQIASLLLKDLLKASSSFIFLGGVHGVGKATVSEQVFIPAGYHCVTASSLIKAYGIQADQNKRVYNIAGNQNILIEQLNLEKQRHGHLLLDGHYCLINSRDEVESIDIEVFRKISPDAFVLLKGCSDEIVRRLRNRDGKKWNRLFLEQFQRMEQQHAQHIADELSTPFYVISNKEASHDP